MALRAAVAVATVSVGRRRQPNSPLLSGIPLFLIITRHHVSLSNHTPVSSPQIQTWNKYSIRAIQQGAAVAPMKGEEGDEEKSPQSWKVKMLYDGDCPLCMREVNMLKERDKRYEAIKFVDISSDEYSPDDNQGLDYEAVC